MPDHLKSVYDGHKKPALQDPGEMIKVEMQPQNLDVYINNHAV